MKVFLSLPTDGTSEEEIELTRSKMVKEIKKLHPGSNVAVLNPYKEGASEDISLLFLGDAIQTLNNVDAAYFTNDWKYARGCSIIYQVCEAYGIPVFVLDPLGDI